MQLSITSDLEVIEDEWRCFEQRADCTPFQTFDWLSAWQRCIGGPAGVKPAIVTGRQDNGELLFMLPLAIERARFLADEYRPFLTRTSRRCVFLGHALCDYNAPLLAPEFSRLVAPADFASWWRAVAAFIQKTQGYNYDVVLFDKMPARIGRQANPLIALGTMLNPNRAYRTCLGSDWESFYAAKRSSATRKKARKKYRRLADNGELRLVTATDPEERQSTLRILFHQKSRWLARKEPTRSDLFAQPGHSNFYLSVAARADPLVHVSRLEVGSTCAATNLGLRFRGCYYYLLTSYDDGPLGRLGPGVILLHELMRFAISQGFMHFDFSIGHAPYKLEWADEVIELHDHVSAAGWLGLPAAAEIILAPRAKRLLRKSPLLWQLARRVKSGFGLSGEWSA